MNQVVPKIIIGTSGQVANALREKLLLSGNKVWTTSRTPDPSKNCFFLDLGNPRSITAFFSEFSTKFLGKKTDVYLPGAITHVDKCEQEPKRCYELNAEGPSRVAEVCYRYGYRLCFYSSEYVFGEAEYRGGKIGPFSEIDPPAPTSIYGKSKLEAENSLLKISPNFKPLIIRTTMVFSYDKNGLNFVMQVRRHIERWLKGDHSQSFRIPVDQISTPTYAPALADASIHLMNEACSGIYHIVGRDLLSRKEFIERIIDFFSYPKEEAMQAFQFLATAELAQSAKRPLSAGLKTEKAEKAGVKIWDLEKSFGDFSAREQS